MTHRHASALALMTAGALGMGVFNCLCIRLLFERIDA